MLNFARENYQDIIQQLAGMSATLSSQAPWNDLATAAHCEAGPLEVECASHPPAPPTSITLSPRRR